MRKTKVVVLFGSRSVEHEVSVVTAMQVFENIDKGKYEVVALYADKQGRMWSGEKLKQLTSYKNLELKTGHGLIEYYFSQKIGDKKLIPVGGLIKKPVDFDIVLMAVHGTFGEDGTIQGVLETLDIPYTGSGVTASAIGMDKVMQKAVFEKEGVPVVKYIWFNRSEWEVDEKRWISEVETKLGYPVFVKPANLGSSVGINKVKNRKDLKWAVAVAKEFDRKIIVEEGLENIDEINVSVMGVEDFEVSVCEMPVRDSELLTYEDKYLKGGKIKGMASLSRLVPAPISTKLTKEIQDLAVRAFRAAGASGLARVDFMVNQKTGKKYITEINTLPGSLAFYLWEKSGYPFARMLDRLVKLGFERYELRKKINFSYDSKLLETQAKGSKR